jgi:hypothetical protein
MLDGTCEIASVVSVESGQDISPVDLWEILAITDLYTILEHDEYDCGGY